MWNSSNGIVLEHENANENENKIHTESWRPRTFMKPCTATWFKLRPRYRSDKITSS